QASEHSIPPAVLVRQLAVGSSQTERYTRGLVKHHANRRVPSTNCRLPTAPISSRHEHRHQRLLAPGVVGRGPDGAADRFLDEVEVLAARARDALYGSDRGIEHDVLERLARRVSRRDADSDEIRIAGDLVAIVEHDVDGDVAGEGQLAAVL